MYIFIKEVTDMIFKLPIALEDVLEEIKLKPIDFMELENKLTEEELSVLEVIISRNTKAEYRLYIREMCLKLQKRGKLPGEYVRLTTI